MERLTGTWATRCTSCKTRMEKTFTGQTLGTFDPLCEGCRNVWTSVPADDTATPAESAGIEG